MIMNARIFRCGWCGCPTQEDGKPLDGDTMKKAINIIETYGDGKTTKVNGWCCPSGCN